VRLENLVAVTPGRSPQAIVFMAHRDDAGQAPGANDNASGIAALIELARANAAPAPSASQQLRALEPAHTLIFLATDGGSFGGIGAARFAKTYSERVLAAVNLDALAGKGPPRLVFAGSQARSPAAALVEAAALRVQEETGVRPARTSVLGQLVDLAFPYSLYEQAPFVAQGIPAVTLTTEGERPSSSAGDVPGALDVKHLAQLGRAAQALLHSLDQGAELAQGTSSYLYLGPRIIRGWAVELVLIAALLPFLVATVDLFARCRRRHVQLAPALRSYRSRFAFWLWTGAVFETFALLGVWPQGVALPVAPGTSAAGRWPFFGILGLVVLSALGWLVTRERLLPRRRVTRAEELAGATVALLVLAVIGLVVVATNPFALIFVLPSLHAWLWLPHVRERPVWARAGLFAVGLAGPALLIGSFAIRYGLGLDAPWYLAELAAIRYVKIPTIALTLGWLAAGGQVAALAAGRYAPYPSAAERPPRGPLRNVVRRLVLAARSRRRASGRPSQALEI
jgi:hypothetical protein